MKLIIIAQSILLIYLFALKTNPSEKVILINDNSKVDIIVTDSILSCKSVLGENGNIWSHWHKVELKQGINEFDFVPLNGARIEIKITKY